MLTRVVASLLIGGLWPAMALAQPDPRPTVLVIAGDNASPFETGLAWPGLIAEQHPEWRVIADADSSRTLGDLLADKPADGKARTLADVLAGVNHADLVVLLFGTNEARSKNWSAADDAKLGAQMADLLKRLKADPKTAKATLVVCTPVPVVDVRLDQYSREAFANEAKEQQGQKRTAAIAEAFKKAAADAGASVVDVYGWSLADEEGGKPGRIVGSIGWKLRDWGHPILAKYMDEQLSKLPLAPRDPAAFEAWKKEREADLKLDQLLSRTSAGTVAHGEALPGKYEPAAGKVAAHTVVTVPADLLKGPAFSVLAMPSTKPMAVLTPGSEIKSFAANRPVLSVETDKGKVDIVSPPTEWQVLTESEPDRATESDRWRFNAVKMRFFAVCSQRAGERMWTLMRFPLDGLEGQTVKSATMKVTYGPGVFKFSTVDGKPKEEPVAGSDLGEAAFYAVTGPDAQWSNSRATWKTRDGSVGWTGGMVDAAARKAALTEFLAGNPPPGAAQRAKAELAKLGS